MSVWKVESHCVGMSNLHQSTMEVTPLSYAIMVFEEKMSRQVFCVKLQKELPGLDEPPFDTELGRKIYENVSKDAWNMWMEHCKMLLNEYRLNPARKEDQQVIVQQLEQYFFGEGSALPKEYLPPPAH